MPCVSIEMKDSDQAACSIFVIWVWLVIIGVDGRLGNKPTVLQPHEERTQDTQWLIVVLGKEVRWAVPRCYLW